MGNDLRLFRVLSLKTITGSLPFFYPILRLDRIQFNFTIYHIETFYNTVRIHSHCGFKSPKQLEDEYQTQIQNLVVA